MKETRAHERASDPKAMSVRHLPVTTPVTDNLARMLEQSTSEDGAKAAIALARHFERALRRVEALNSTPAGSNPRQGKTVLVARQALEGVAAALGFVHASAAPAANAPITSDLYDFPGRRKIMRER